MKNSIYFIIVAIFLLPGCKKHDEKKRTKPSRNFQWAEYYDYYDRRDSAFYFYNQVIDNSLDSLEKGQAYFKMGLFQVETGDYYSAQESLLAALKVLNPDDTAHYETIAASYNTLSNATLELGEYDSAVQNYNTAFNFVTDQNNKLNILNNLGMAYQKKGDYKKAIAIFDSAVAQPTTDTSLKARIISNAARTKWLADSNYFALPELMAALTLRKLARNPLGMSTSFDHLAAYYAHTRPDSAFFYALKRFEVLQTFQNPNDRLSALGQLIDAIPPSQTKDYATQYKHLDDSLEMVRSKNRNQFVLIKSGAEKVKSSNRILQKHIVEQRMAMSGIIILAALLLLASIALARRRRKKLKQESENRLRESRLKTSQKVHDVVANGLYVIMNELEHGKTIEKEALIARIEGLYEKSRNISYEDNAAGSNGEYDKQISQLLTSFASEQTKVVIAGNGPAFWKRVSDHPKQELQLVLKELMVNMKKHSQANNVVVVFKQENNKGLISYTDDGIGFRPDHQFGNGLNNTVNRIKSLHGEVIFGKSEKDGASITISFPLQSGKT